MHCAKKSLSDVWNYKPYNQSNPSISIYFQSIFVEKKKFYPIKNKIQGKFKWTAFSYKLYLELSKHNQKHNRLYLLEGKKDSNTNKTTKKEIK